MINNPQEKLDPKVSIVMAAYNEESGIGGALERASHELKQVE
jgi:glycosyltransferase involved in cell wall biosynthesis